MNTNRILPAALTFVLVACSGLPGCTKKVDAKQCNEMLDRFAELVVKERFPDAGAEAIAAERARERSEARNDDAFKNCTSEVQPAEHACAMGAATPEALLKCLE